MVDIDAALSISDSKEKISALLAILDSRLAAPTPSSLNAVVSRVLAEDVPAPVSKAVMNHLASNVQRIPANIFEEVVNFALVAIKQSPINLDEPNYPLRNELFNYYINCGEFADAAATLAGVNLDSTTRPFSDEEKVDILIKCAEAYLENDMSGEAENFMNKSAPYISSITNWVLQLRYKVTFARVLDANRKFAEAAMRYYELSTLSHESLVQEELLELLAKATTCAILSKIGVQRTRTLALICNDERLADLELNARYGVHATIVRKMFKEQIVKAEEAKQLETVLAEHQRAVTGDGSTVLQKAIIEHNMLAASKIYSNVYLSELASILSVDERRAEKIAASMIAENRLKAFIDQVTRVVVFDESDDQLAQRDLQIANLCKDIAAFVDLAREHYPQTI